MKIRNNPNKRQAAIIEYLNKNGKVTTNEIRNLLINDENYGKRIPKSTFSEDIKFLKDNGYPIVQSYGYISLDKQETDKEIVYHEKLCSAIIRRWIILYNLNSNYSIDEWGNSSDITKEDLRNSCKSMYEKLAKNPDAMSDIMFYKDLNELKKEGYIGYEEVMDYPTNIDYYVDCDDKTDCLPKKMTYVFPRVDLPSLTKICKYDAELMYKFVNNEIGIIYFKDLKELLEKYWPEMKNPIESVEEKYSNYRIASQKALNMFKRFENLLYKKKCLDITYCCGKKRSDTILYRNFETMTAIFTKGSKRFFLLGRCVTDNSSREYLLSFEHITDIQVSDVENTIYGSNIENVEDIFNSLMYNKNPDKEKIINRYKKVNMRRI